MRLYIIFALIDLLIVVAYPIVYVLGKIRQLFGFKR